MARAAARAGLPYTLSTLSTRSIEEVRAGQRRPPLVPGLRLARPRAWCEEMIERAAAAGYEALVLTVDTAVLGRRERDVRRGFSLPPTIGPGTLVDGALHPALDVGVRAQRADPLRQRRRPRRRRRRLAGHAVGLHQHPVRPRRCRGPTSTGCARSGTARSSLKGIQTVEDAVLAADAGVEAIALSNHGGRQLDGAPATFDLVAPVADAVGGRTEIICDGGVRRGSDIVKAVAAGATAAMAGRAYLYGLGAAGERGVDRVLDWFAADLRRTMSPPRLRPPSPTSAPT